MKRFRRTEGKYDLVRLFDQHVQQHGSSFSNQATDAAFLAQLAQEFTQARKNGILLHGLRAQAMFAYVASGLGCCALIKEEDSGEIHSHEAEIIAPDYRIMLKDGREFFVEVKNYRPDDVMAGYRIQEDYFAKLQNYARIFGRPLYVAIFWSQLKIWTLHTAEDFMREGEDWVLSLLDAVQHNRMEMFGEATVGTIPSLTFTLYSDPGKPRSIAADNTAAFTTAEAKLFCGTTELTDPADKRIAWFLMNYGRWPCESSTEVLAGELISASLNVAPEERANPDQRFEFIGSLSEMLSRKFNALTTNDGEISKLTSQADVTLIEAIIPPDHNSEALPLWRIKQVAALPDDKQ